MPAVIGISGPPQIGDGGSVAMNAVNGCSVDAKTHDPELIECLIESSYAYTGPAPSAAIETTTTVSWLGGQPDALDDDAWRQQMFDAVVVAHLADLDACAGDAEGSLLVELDFGDGANATAVRTEGDGLPSERVDCVAAAAAQWRFPRSFAGRTMAHALRFPIDAPQ